MRPVVELAKDRDIRVFDLYDRRSGSAAATFYAGKGLGAPTVAYVKLPSTKARSTGPHRDRQRKRLHLVAEHTSRALPAPDEDESQYAKLRTDRRGRLLTETGRLLPEASSPQIRGLLTGPKG